MSLLLLNRFHNKRIYLHIFYLVVLLLLILPCEVSTFQCLRLLLVVFSLVYSYLNYIKCEVCVYEGVCITFHPNSSIQATGRIVEMKGSYRLLLL